MILDINKTESDTILGFLSELLIGKANAVYQGEQTPQKVQKTRTFEKSQKCPRSATQIFQKPLEIVRVWNQNINGYIWTDLLCIHNGYIENHNL